MSDYGTKGQAEVLDARMDAAKLRTELEQVKQKATKYADLLRSLADAYTDLYSDECDDRQVTSDGDEDCDYCYGQGVTDYGDDCKYCYPRYEDCGKCAGCLAGEALRLVGDANE